MCVLFVSLVNFKVHYNYYMNFNNYYFNYLTINRVSTLTRMSGINVSSQDFWEICKKCQEKLMICLCQDFSGFSYFSTSLSLSFFFPSILSPIKSLLYLWRRNLVLPKCFSLRSLSGKCQHFWPFLESGHPVNEN